MMNIVSEREREREIMIKTTMDLAKNQLEFGLLRTSRLGIEEKTTEGS